MSEQEIRDRLRQSITMSTPIQEYVREEQYAFLNFRYSQVTQKQRTDNVYGNVQQNNE